MRFADYIFTGNFMDAKKELNTVFWKQIAASNVRKLMTMLGTVLVSHGFISEDQSAGIITTQNVEYVVGFLFIVAPIVWSYLKVKFNINFAINAIYSEPPKEGTTVSRAYDNVAAKVVDRTTPPV